MVEQDVNMVQMAIDDYKQGLGEITKKLPKVAKAYNAFTKVCFEEGKLSQKDKQLIALAISIFAQDEYCIIYHTKGCLDQGCTEEEILEAIGVAAAFGGGSVMSQSVTLVLESIQELSKDTQSVT
ncbi:MAG TPA: carboxymuconolactone decarboxylase family protein [Bacilli bacterium]|nr:carboxymuconolactone decarboxylase family protein [Bacilli bacterium]